MKGPCRGLFVQGSPKTFFFLLPSQNEKKYSCGTKCWIKLKQGSKFEFVHGLNVYKKKRIINFDHQKTLIGPFCAAVPSKELRFYHPTKMKVFSLEKLCSSLYSLELGP